MQIQEFKSRKPLSFLMLIFLLLDEIINFLSLFLFFVSFLCLIFLSFIISFFLLSVVLSQWEDPEMWRRELSATMGN